MYVVSPIILEQTRSCLRPHSTAVVSKLILLRSEHLVNSADSLIEMNKKHHTKKQSASY